jgi:uncharacterized protein YndB with AHSA1/START domain
MKMRILWIAAAAAAVVSAPARADVVDSSPSGFTVRLSASIAAPAATVYQTLVSNVGSWWNPEHTWSGQAANLSIDPSPGGCFCEKLPNGGVRHLTVVYADAGKTLRLTGGLGPFQDMGVAGVLTFSLNESAGTTTLVLTYKVGGYLPNGSDGLGKGADGMLNDQLQRLKRYVETGHPG